jgi:hypothetical protein
MSVHTSIGQAFMLQGRAAGAEAVHEALRDFRAQNVSLGMVFASANYDMKEIISGVTTQLGDTPLIGFSTPAEINTLGSHRRSVVVALLAADDLEVRADWVPGVMENTLRTVEQLIQTLHLGVGEEGTLFLVGDGISNDGDVLCKSFPSGDYQFFGCLAGGDLRQGRTFQIGGAQVGTGGLAGALLKSDELVVGVGAAHGWQTVGAYFKVTQARGPWVRFLDNKPASESYAALFGRAARDWSFPPLNTLIRLYPLGIEDEEKKELQVRTPLRVEADGSLRMNALVPNGSVGHLMVGGTKRCLDAARLATSNALKQLEGATPKLALVFADVSWEMLMRGQPGGEVQAVRDVLGKEVPVAGGYTFGQIAQLNDSPIPEYLNQHIEVVIIGER